MGTTDVYAYKPTVEDRKCWMCGRFGKKKAGVPKIECLRCDVEWFPLPSPPHPQPAPGTYAYGWMNTWVTTEDPVIFIDHAVEYVSCPA